MIYVLIFWLSSAHPNGFYDAIYDNYKSCEMAGQKIMAEKKYDFKDFTCYQAPSIRVAPPRKP